MKSILSLLVIAALAVSCAKGTCDNAVVCMVNNTQDTVRYSWNSNRWDKVLLPGEKACRELGEKKWNESFTTYFESDHGFHALDVSECNHTYNLD